MIKGISKSILGEIFEREVNSSYIKHTVQTKEKLNNENFRITGK